MPTKKKDPTNLYKNTVRCLIYICQQFLVLEDIKYYSVLRYYLILFKERDFCKTAFIVAGFDNARSAEPDGHHPRGDAQRYALHHTRLHA
jgi:hypothetical protein